MSVLTNVLTSCHDSHMTTNALKTAANAHSTSTLIGALLLLDAKDSLDEAERMTYAVTADVITEREGINDAMDEVFMDLDFEGTYADAILICLEKVAA